MNICLDRELLTQNQYQRQVSGLRELGLDKAFLALLPTRIVNILNNEGLADLETITQKSGRELVRIWGLGLKSLLDIELALACVHLKLRDDE
jgi:DNA-directed RNA polymerase alpha subunit